MKLNFNFSDVCQFSHSEEECKVWNYMKENNSKFFHKKNPTKTSEKELK